MTTTLPDGFWQTERLHLARIIGPRMQALASAGIRQAEKKLNNLGIYLDNSIVHQRAADWAKSHTDEILSSFNTRTSDMVGPKISSFIETPGLKMKDLVESLKPVLDDNISRAWTVAVTETTRAYAAGNDLAYQSVGIPPIAFLPPLHVNCRCDTGVRRIRSANAWVVVWYTDSDSLVCHTVHDAPWGPVAGCRDMHLRIISEGPWLGKKFGEVQ